MIQFNVNFEGTGAVIRGLSSIRNAVVRKGALQMIADEAVALIKTRTLEGLDQDDRPLKPSKRAEREGGQTLSDKGHMLGALSVVNCTAKRATIGFGSMLEAKKAWWAQDGTKPHVITAGPGKSIPFFTSGIAMPSYVKVGSHKAKPLERMRPGETGRGFGFAKRVHHPGTVKRPFFGISPRDATSLQKTADDYLAFALARAEAGAR